MSIADAGARRVETQRQYVIPDTPPDPALEEVVRTAARLLGTPIALISLVDDTHQWCKASVGLDLPEAGVAFAFSVQAIETGLVMMVPDVAADPRFAQNPLVTGKPGIRFFAAAPLMTRDGQTLGALCVMDTKARPPLTEQANGTFEALAHLIVAKLEARRAVLKTAIWSAKLEHLSSIALKLSRCADRADVLQTTADEALQLFGAAICLVRVRIDNGERETGSAGFDQLRRDETAAARIIIDNLEAAASRGGSVLRVNGAALRARAVAKAVVLPLVTGFDFWMAAPVRCDADSCVGTLLVAGGQPFRIEDEAILGQLAQLLGGALQNRLMIDRAGKAETHFRILFERNPNPMWVYDRETLRFLEINDAAIELYGWSRAEFREMTVLDLRPPEERGRLVETLKEMGTTLHHHGEWRHITRSGQDLYVLIAAYYGMELEGRPVGLTVVHDITERKRVDQALAESEARFRNMADTVPGMLWVTDAADKTVFVNRRWHDYIGGEPDDHALGWENLIHPEDLEVLLTSVAGWSKLHQPFSVTYRLRRHDGEYRWFLDTASPRIAPDGVFLGYVGAAVDITERMRVEQALAESEERFRGIADTIPGILWIVDAKGKPIFINRQWRAHTGCKEGEDHARDWATYIHPEDLEGLTTSFTAAMKLCQPFSVNYRLRRHDGEYRWFLNTGSPRLAPDGSLLGFIGAALDVTDQRRLEAELRQAQKMQAVGQLTGGIAHDFNNLLTIILGTSELIAAETAEDPYLSQLSEMTRSAANRGTSLVRRLLAFSRHEPLQPRVTDINRLIADMNDMLLRTLGEDVSVAVALPDGLWPASIDPVQLETALLNLAINARDAMAEGGSLRIETENLTVAEGIIASDETVVPGDYLSISVIDTGAGMSPEVVAQIFEPFFTTKEVGKGTGLGLSMVYGFVKQSGGYIRVTSEPGAGTTLSILLPRTALDAEAIAEADSPAPPAGGSSQTILLVEDEPQVRSMLAEQLKRLGYSVVVAANGPSALVMLDEHEDIDLLLTDIVMPAGMNGRQLATAAQALRPGIRLLFISGHSDDRPALQGPLPGGQPLLQKPIEKAVLAEALRAALADEAA